MGPMRRREFITLVGSVGIACPLSARAQQQTTGVRRIGVLLNGEPTEAGRQELVAAFIAALHQLGWNEGQNIQIDVRWNAGKAELAREYAKQLVGLSPDVIVAATTMNLMVVREATGTVPIVFVAVSDPVAQGFVANLNRPGGNITGFSEYPSSIGGKWLQLLKQIAPGIVRLAVIFNPDTSPQSQFFLRSINAAATSLGVQTMVRPVRSTAEIEPAIEAVAREPGGCLIVPPDAFMRLREQLVADTANRHRVPSMGSSVNFVQVGGLLYYGLNVDLKGQYRQAAGYVDRILKGEQPSNLPVQGPTKYELAVNLKTAKLLGLAVPLSLRATAVDVVE